MRTSTPLLLVLALAAGSACAADVPADGATSRAARREQFQQRFLDQVDADHDGVVSRAEYQAWIDARFDRLDANGDGRVDADEIAASPQAAQRAHKRSERFIARYDTSGTGSVGKADFEAKEMARFDRASGGADTVDAARLLPRRGFGRRHSASVTPDDEG